MMDILCKKKYVGINEPLINLSVVSFLNTIIDGYKVIKEIVKINLFNSCLKSITELYMEL